MTVQIRPKTLARQARFLEKYLVSRTVTLAAARADLATVTVYKWRHANPEFKATFDRIAAEHARRRDVKRHIRCLGHLPVLKSDLPIKSIAWAPSSECPGDVNQCPTPGRRLRSRESPL